MTILFAASCAATNPKPSPSPSTAELPPLPRSSIAAVLEHRAELELTDEQIRRLQELDDRLDKENAAIRKNVTQNKEPPTQMERGGFAGGMGRRSHGGGAGRSSAGGGGASNDPARPKSPMQLMDDNDTSAYLEAETALTEAQRHRAREIASRFREELSDRREAARKQRSE